jgi:DNA-binding transcriptional ArsR family regulator
VERTAIADRRVVPDYEADDVLVVTEPEQLRALGDELRTKIVALLREHARSTTELAAELGAPKGTVAHHVKVLEKAGLIRVVRTRQVRAVTERFYGRVARLFVFKAEDPADARALGAAALRQAADEIAAAPEGATFGLVRARLSAPDAKRLERRLERLIDDFRAREVPHGVLTGLAVGMWPAERGDA